MKFVSFGDREPAFLSRAFSLAVLLAALWASQATAQPATKSQPATAVRVEAYLRRVMKSHKIPGLQVAVIQHGKLALLGAYGIANVEDSVPVSNQTVFPVHSITKAFVGVALLQLVEKGKLDLTLPISHYLDGLPPAWRAVTVRQLATHVSGIPDLWNKGAGMVAEGEEALWKKLQSLPMEFPTGNRFSYNQTNYLLLGKLIDTLSGEPFTRFIAQHQFQVVGMPRSGFGDAHDVVPHLAGTYCFCLQTPEGPVSTEQLKTVLRDWPPSIRTATGLNTTAEELSRWIIALQAGKLLQPKSLGALWTPGTLNDGSVAVMNPLIGGYAIGWPLVIRPEHPAIASTGGNRAAVFIYPEDDLTIILLTNLIGSGPEQFIDTLAGFYLPQMRSSGFGLPPSIQALRAELLRQGFKNAPAALKSLQAKDSQLKFSEGELLTWAYQLLELGEDAQSIEVFKLTVALYPKSANTYDSLAEAYEMTGDKERAIAHYARSLELDPKNTNAVAHLAKLRGTRPSLQN